MIFLFTKSNKIGSRLIRWGMKHPTEPDYDVSHMATLKGQTPEMLSIVMEARLSTGVDITWLKSFLGHNEIVYAFTPRDTSILDQEAVFDLMAKKIGGKKYDWKAIGFLAASVVVCLKVLGTKLPVVNKWADKEDFFCSEMLQSISGYLSRSDIKIGLYGKQMLTPNRAVDLFIGNDNFKDVTLLFEEIE